MSKADYKNPIPSKSQHALIVQQLGLKIVSGEISENEKLPSEVDLCEEYKVSRPVFREAIRVLNAKGLTYSRPKIGTVVRPKEEWHLLDPDVLFWLIQTTPEHEFLKHFLPYDACWNLSLLILPQVRPTKKILNVLNMPMMGWKKRQQLKNLSSQIFNFIWQLPKQPIMTYWLICQNAGFTFAAIDSSHQSSPKFTRPFVTKT